MSLRIAYPLSTPPLSTLSLLRFAGDVDFRSHGNDRACGLAKPRLHLPRLHGGNDAAARPRAVPEGVVSTMTTTEQPQRTLTARVVFTAPGQQANGLAAAPEGLWICDQRNDHCYLVRYDTGATISAFPSPVRNASGIAYGAGSVWPAANRLPAATYRHDAKTGHCLADLVFPDSDQGGSPRHRMGTHRPGGAGSTAARRTATPAPAAGGARRRASRPTWRRRYAVGHAAGPADHPVG